MEFDLFLKGALPELGYDWRRHRRRGVRRKVLARVAELGLPGLGEYLGLLRSDPAETLLFRSMLTVTISRFYRDPKVFGRLRESVLPEILKEGAGAGVWCCGAASGEEPYTLAIIAAEDFPGEDVRITATDIDSACMSRAADAVFGESSLRLLPGASRERWFDHAPGGYALRAEITRRVRFLRHDILADAPLGGMDLVLCRNLAFTYFGLTLQNEVTIKLHRSLNRGGYLVIGRTEFLPGGTGGLFRPVFPEEKVYRKA